MSNFRIDTYYDYVGIKKRVPIFKSTYKNIYVNKDLEDKLVDFKAKNNVTLKDAIDDVISYLKLKKLTKEYILIYEGVSLKVGININRDVLEKNMSKIYTSGQELQFWKYVKSRSRGIFYLVKLYIIL